MSTSITSSMFDSIKQALAKNENSNAGKFLKTEVGNTYTVRLLPNIKDPSKTFFHYFTFGWTSFSTGQYITTVSPQTWGDRDPINEYRYKATKMGSEQEKEKAAKILRKENWMVNVYVINDPKNPDNNGTVKLLKFGRQLHKIIMEAIEGEDSDGLGSRIFDLTAKGCDFKIKVDKQGDYPSYSSSKFVLPKAIDGMTPEKIETIYNGTSDLERVYTVKSYDELQKMLDEHFHCAGTTKSATAAPKTAPKPQAAPPAAVEDEAPWTESKNVTEASNALDESSEDDDIQKILKELNG
jgi:hypothetical protein